MIFDENTHDLLNFEEPMVIRLMLGGMFNKKKSMLEALEMCPNISVDNIKKEF